MYCHCVSGITLFLQVKLPLEGRTWAMAESIEAGELEAVSSPSPLPPAVVTQHAHPSRQFILVSTKGSYLIGKQRPVDQLRGLLEAGKGGCSEPVKAFFKLHRVRERESVCVWLKVACTVSSLRFTTTRKLVFTTKHG